MIDFEQVWLPQIVQYARLIGTGQLENEWLGRVTPATSVTDPDELHEQVFDDLDADRIWAENQKLSASQVRQRLSVTSAFHPLQSYRPPLG